MRKIFSIITLLAFVFSGCGKEDFLGRNEAASADATAKSQGLTPPKGYYDEALLKSFQSLNSQSTGDNPYLYLAFGNIQVTYGFGNHQSFIPCQPTSDIKAVDLTSEEKNAILAQVQKLFKSSMPSLGVSDTLPSSGDYKTVIMTDSITDLGCKNSNVAGLAPVDLNNLNKNDVAFVFIDAFTMAAPDDSIASQIVYQANQTFGLSGNGQPLALAATPSANPTLPGVQIIDGFYTLLTDLQNDFKNGQKIDITSLLAQIDAIFPGGLGGIPGGATSLANLSQVGGLQSLDEIITIFGLAAGAAKTQNPGINFSTINLTQLETLIAQVLTIFSNPSSGGLQQLMTWLSSLASGNTALTDVINLIQQVINGVTATTNPLNILPVSQLPNFATLLGLSQYTDVPSLMVALEQHAQYVESKYTGDQEAALLSMLKIGYAQAYDALEQAQ